MTVMLVLNALNCNIFECRTFNNLKYFGELKQCKNVCFHNLLSCNFLQCSFECIIFAEVQNDGLTDGLHELHEALLTLQLIAPAERHADH